MQDLLTTSEQEQLEFIEQRIARMEQERQALIEQAQVRALQAFTELHGKVVAVIGGKGGLGSIFTQIFSAANPMGITFAIDLDNQDQAPELLPHADLVIFAVPIHQTPALIKHYSQWLKPTAGICDITSIKSPALAAMLEHHQGPVMGLHPMFGIATPSLDKQLIITCAGRNDEYFAPYLKLFELLGARLVSTTAEKHDKIMTHMQAVRHFNTYLQGLFTSQQGFSISELTAMSSPIYGLELTMVGRLFAQNPELYADIIYDNPASRAALASYLETVSTAVNALLADNKDEFIKNFTRVQEFYGDYAPEFLQQSAVILEKAVELKQLDPAMLNNQEENLQE
ncbi:bifunctional chorismate mutase/prephenate dehydrogenase [Psittacicella hinzii]|uniref:Bifunctional chorismate mutase/prephenate dehydrogenase n=1 Tax=Psittacicella hinzii TaxID=2028575 RepID=A0A3A1YST2_9GAMM|nr:bifunctional chorismate mutase/prephenate dehydrogenase [Psittacicella hinzii]RIY39980.1 bifunctional chorismate mutase/prephenate dehydrogenase [Psittacicella hinzii]